MASPTKNFNTQRTFDSTDDLLEVEDGEEELQEVADSPVDKDSPLWDVRAFHWPPRPVKNTISTIKEYVSCPYRVLEILLLGVFLLLCYFSPDYLVEAHHRPIPIQTTSAGDHLIDLTFANEYNHDETIPGPLLTLLTVALPFALFGAYSLLLGPKGDLHAILSTYMLTMGSKIFIVAVLKNYAGYLRPNFYNMCQFNPDTLLCDDETTSARESFPSGHAATAMSAMTLVALYLLGKVRGGNRQRGIKVDRRMEDDLWTPNLPTKVLSVGAVSPLVLGMFIAASRVRDDWHHPADVLTGGVIGAGCALLAHGLYYPSVKSFYGGIPLETVQSIVMERKKLVSKSVELTFESEV